MLRLKRPCMSSSEPCRGADGLAIRIAVRRNGQWRGGLAPTAAAKRRQRCELDCSVLHQQHRQPVPLRPSPKCSACSAAMTCRRVRSLLQKSVEATVWWPEIVASATSTNAIISATPRCRRGFWQARVLLHPATSIKRRIAPQSLNWMMISTATGRDCKSAVEVEAALVAAAGHCRSARFGCHRDSGTARRSTLVSTGLARSAYCPALCRALV